MKTLKKLLYYVILPVFFITSCDENPVSPEPPGGGPPNLPPWPSQLSMVEPSAEETYWTDLSVPCKTNASDKLADKLIWKVNGETVNCEDGALSFSFEEGEYEITVQREDKETDNDEATINVMVGFSVSIISPEEGEIYFTGDKILCSVEITPEKYQGEVRWKNSNQEINCSDGFVINEAGEYSLVSEVTFKGRTETDVVRTEVLPVITGKVYPFTSNGVVSTSNLQVTLTTQGNKSSSDVNAEANVASNGNFTIRTEAVKDMHSTNVRLHVSGNGDFYSSVAELSGSDLLDLVENGELGFILPPKRWTIPSGKLQGKSTDISLLDAFESGTSDFQFYDPLITILKHNRPVKTAISRKYYKDITPQDSVNLWKNKLRLLEEYLGLGELFTPADESEVPTTQDGFLAIINPDRPRSGANFTIEDGSIIGGFMAFKHIEFFESQNLHEPTHMVGFGHTCKWRSIMSETFECSSLAEGSPTVDDVSYMQLAYLVRDFQYEQNVPFGLEGAYAAL